MVKKNICQQLFFLARRIIRAVEMIQKYGFDSWPEREIPLRKTFIHIAQANSALHGMTHDNRLGEKPVIRR